MKTIIKKISITFMFYKIPEIVYCIFYMIAISKFLESY